MNKNMTSFLQGLTLISHLGFVMAFPIVGGAFIGDYVDKKLGTNLLFLLIFIVLGLAIGIYSAYRLIMNIDQGNVKTKKKKEP